MRENEWTESICELLKKEYLGNNICVEVLKKIPYAYEIKSFNDEWEIEEEDTSSFETDLVIYEKYNSKIIPRVIIEAKVDKVTTHDAITYSHKASNHKNVMPYIRYGIMIGNREHYPLPGRLFRHGINFDFLFSFVGYVPTEREMHVFADMLRKEIKYSREYEEILNNSRSRGRKKYFMMQKEMYLMELEDNIE